MLSKEEVQLAIIARFPRICSTHCWPLYMFVLESTQVSFSIFAKSTYPSYSIFLPNNFINSLSSMNLSGRLQKNQTDTTMKCSQNSGTLTSLSKVMKEDRTENNPSSIEQHSWSSVLEFMDAARSQQQQTPWRITLSETSIK